ncbi:hypothetical protein BUALT_Bualt04G0095800 [Buddleja alternifolia]|uniref:Retrotransposon gag domain-containing protein n=1 Tax=Buddleja alternifolia TaxID=168488 RepID=A0AAV6XYU3_9LAMI|nr:hypothetical protein BUALT_Bualt04G0095800 [Buddleja alternifolia]
MAKGTRNYTTLREDVDGLKATMEEMRNMIANMYANQNIPPEVNGQGFSGEIGEGSHSHRGHGGLNQGYQVSTKRSTIEFPKFNGKNLRGWVYRCEQFFEMDETPNESKVKLAAVHLEGRALQWHQMYMKSRLTRQIPDWEEYVRALHDRFGAFLYDDPMSKLVNLKQTGSIQDYLDKFDELMNCIELVEPYAISCFLGGIKHDIYVQKPAQISMMHVRILHKKLVTKGSIPSLECTDVTPSVNISQEEG